VSSGAKLALWCQRHCDFRDVLGSGGSRDWKATAKKAPEAGSGGRGAAWRRRRTFDGFVSALDALAPWRQPVGIGTLAARVIRPP
jgi:hypothetical protein